VQIANAHNDAEYFESVNEISQVVELAGCSMWTTKHTNKQILLAGVCHFVFVGHLGAILKE
jgi:hypothetical protein